MRSVVRISAEAEVYAENSNYVIIWGMNSFVQPVESYLDGTVTQVIVDWPMHSHDDLTQAVDVAGVRLSDLFPDVQPGLDDPVLRVHPTIHHNQQQAERDPVSIEYIPHYDGSCEPQRPEATLVVAREAGIDAPPTRFFSTVGLLALAKDKGIFRNFDPADVNTIFGYSAYYRHAQSLWLELEPDAHRLHEVIQNDIARFGGNTREEMIANLDDDPKKGPRPFPLVSVHPVTAEDCIMFDAGARNIGLAPKENGLIDQGDLDEAHGMLRLLLADVDMLKAEGIVAEVTPRTGCGVAFTKQGLHNQVPHRSESARLSPRRMSVLGLVPRSAA